MGKFSLPSNLLKNLNQFQIKTSQFKSNYITFCIKHSNY